jgi:damage-control phosphatase, subfamily I
MRTRPECLTCILGDVYAAARQLAGPEAALEVARAASGYLAGSFDLAQPPSYPITQVHRLLKHILGLPVPFAEQRRRANDIGREVAVRIAAEAATAGDPRDRLRLVAQWALAGNSLDSRTAGTGYTFDPATSLAYLSGYVQRGLAEDQLDALYDLVRRKPRVLFIHDNVGEMALDVLLIRELRDLGCFVTAAVRGGPITSDATWDDAIYLGLDREADRLILAGPDTLGISFAEMSPELRRELGQADLVIAKGQANYYVLSEYREQVPGAVFCLFTVKCAVVGEVLGVERRSAMALFI